MTFRFDELTWPEVAALNKATPLLLPIGNLPLPKDLSEIIRTDQPVGLLPSIPFGWAGSVLEVQQPAFAALVRNLYSNLLEDGFLNITALVPPGVDLGGDILQRVSPANSLPVHQPSASDTEKVILLPIGHTEQHGYHAPLSTDTIIIEAIAQGVAQAVPEQAVCLPVFPYGVSTHRRSFPGTFNVGGRTFEDFWLSLLDALVARGFRRFYLMSGHGGNSSFLVNVVKYAGEKYPEIFCATS